MAAAASRGRGAAARAMGKAAKGFNAQSSTASTWAEESDIFDTSMRTPLASLLSQVYGKPVELKLTKLAQPHLEASILAAVASERMRGSKPVPAIVQKELVTKIGLPGNEHILTTAAKQALAARSLRRRPSLCSMGTPRFSIGRVLQDLNLKRVTHIRMYIGGRYDKRAGADRAANREAKHGIGAHGPGTMVRQVRKAHIAYAFRAGKRKVGAYGVKTWIGHS